MSVNPPFAVSFFAGSLAHSCEVLTLGHVLDRIKVQQEAHPQCKTAKSALDAVLREDGWRGIYTGLRWNVSLSALKGAFGWSIHNFCNRTVTALYPQENALFPSLPFTILVGVSSAFIEASLILCPLERLKTVEMTYRSNTQLKIGDLVRRGGWRFIYRGWNQVMLRQSCSWLTYLIAYQQLRQPLLNYNAQQPLSLKQKVLLGSVTGSIVACLNAPLDLLKTQAQMANAPDSLNIFKISSSIFKEYGWKGMYNGLSMKLMRNTWSSVSVLLTLDYLGALPQNMRI